MRLAIICMRLNFYIQPMNDITLEQNKILAEFEALPDKDAKWSYLLKIARNHSQIDGAKFDEKYLVKGCATRLFLIPEFVESKLILHIDTETGSDSPLIVRGLGALAARLYSGKPPSDILNSDPAFFQSIGLNVALSATRANGFASLLKQIYLYAKVFSAMAK